jgi:hypothetical protein
MWAYQVFSNQAVQVRTKRRRQAKMKRYLVALQTAKKSETVVVSTRREVIATIGRYLASTPDTCAMLILRRKKEAKHGK